MKRTNFLFLPVPAIPQIFPETAHLSGKSEIRTNEKEHKVSTEGMYLKTTLLSCIFKSLHSHQWLKLFTAIPKVKKIR